MKTSVNYSENVDKINGKFANAGNFCWYWKWLKKFKIYNLDKIDFAFENFPENLKNIPNILDIKKNQNLLKLINFFYKINGIIAIASKIFRKWGKLFGK